MSTEYIQFVLMVVFLLGVLIGSYWFVYAPVKRQEMEERDESASR